MSRTACLAFAAFMMMGGASFCATVEVLDGQDDAPRAVVVQGTLENGDDQKFGAVVQNIPDAVVAFSSGGGSIVAGIGIGEIIRKKRFGTFVADGDTCASACALAWLGGVVLMAGPTAQIGFHAGYTKGQTIPSGPANAVTGAYLAGLGLSRDAIIYVTREAPTSMQWFSFEDARQLGIDVKPFVARNTMSRGKPPVPASGEEASVNAPIPRREVVPDAAQALPAPPSQTVSLPPPVLAVPDVPAPPVLYAGLNLNAGADVRRLQQRLAELGYLTGTADGAWGARSRLALREFKRANGLTVDDLLTQEAGTLLFSPSGRRAPPGFSLPDARADMAGLFTVMPPPQGARLSPLNPADAIAIQKRLEVLGYYAGTGDGTWGDGSRIALADFRVNAGMPPVDDWTSEVEDRLMSPYAPAAQTSLNGTWIPTGIPCSPQALRSGSAFRIGSRVAPDGRICTVRLDTLQGGYVAVVDACSGAAVTVKLVNSELVRLNPNGTPDVFKRCGTR